MDNKFKLLNKKINEVKFYIIKFFILYNKKIIKKILFKNQHYHQKLLDYKLLVHLVFGLLYLE